MKANRKRAKVYRLPTEDKAGIIMFNSELYLNNGYIEDDDQYLLGDTTSNSHQEPKSAFEFQHLYFTTDEEIKDGDWFYNTFGDNQPLIQQRKGNWKTCYNHHKIIATTDPKLTYLSKNKAIVTFEGKDTELDVQKRLPQPPQSFIEEYCKAGGIDEVLVEVGNGYLAKGDSLLINGISYKPKLNPDNTIIIHPVEKKMIPVSEVKSIIIKFYQGLKGLTEEKDRMHLTYDDLDKWIEENLY